MKNSWIKRQSATFLRMWPLLPAAAYCLGFLLIVCVYLLGLTFSGVNSGEVSSLSLKTLRTVFSLPQFKESVLNTGLFVAFGTPLELCTGFFLALLLYKSFCFRSAIRSLFLIPLAVPALVTATLLFILFDFPGGHINQILMGKYPIFPEVLHAPINFRGSKYFALGISLLGKVWRDTPISMIILLAGLNAIDTELIDAAKTMGANFRYRFFRIIIPLMIPSISAVVLLRSIEMWKEFIFPFILAGKYSLMGTLIESLYNDWGNSNEAAAVALILVFCIIITIIVLFLLMEICKKTIGNK